MRNQGIDHEAGTGRNATILANSNQYVSPEAISYISCALHGLQGIQ